jgi:hypothetical protein
MQFPDETVDVESFGTDNFWKVFNTKVVAHHRINTRLYMEKEEVEENLYTLYYIYCQSP